MAEVLNSGEELDREISSWPPNDEPMFAYSKHDGRLSEWSGSFHIYSDLGVANDWNMLRCARLLLLMTLIECSLHQLRSVSSSAQAQLQAIQALEKSKLTIATIIDDLIASFPYCLGRGDASCNMPTAGVGTSGFALLWPTGLILRCPFSSHKQKAIAAETIQYIGHSLGLRRALYLKAAWLNG